MIQQETLIQEYKTRILKKIWTYIVLFILSAIIAYFIIFNTIKLPLVVVLIFCLIAIGSAAFFAYTIWQYFRDWSANTQMIMEGIIINKWSKADPVNTSSGGSSSTTPDTYVIDVKLTSSISTISKRIEGNIYHKLLVGDKVKITYLEFAEDVLAVDILQTSQIVRTSQAAPFTNIAQSIEQQPLTAEEIARATKGNYWYWIVAAVLGIMTAVLGFIFSQPEFDSMLFFYFSIGLMTLLWFLLVNSYVKNKSDIRSGYKLVVVGRVLNKQTLVNDGQDSYNLTITSDVIGKPLSFLVNQSDFDKLLLNDMVKVSYLEQTKFFFGIELVQAAQR